LSGPRIKSTTFRAQSRRDTHYSMTFGHLRHFTTVKSYRLKTRRFIPGRPIVILFFTPTAVLGTTLSYIRQAPEVILPRVKATGARKLGPLSLSNILYPILRGSSVSIVTSFMAFTAVIFDVEVFWVMTPCSVVVGYQCFRGLCCLHLQGD